MDAIKKVWLTPDHVSGQLSTLSIESETVYPEHQRLRISEVEFPSNRPLAERRHVIKIDLLSDEDLYTLMDSIDAYLQLR